MGMGVGMVLSMVMVDPKVLAMWLNTLHTFVHEFPAIVWFRTYWAYYLVCS